ncbi:cobaltochelatase CobT-related protein [Blautia producta]|uniref:cobaltochelatase CobT-related protein n=1 Tax=Blautia producta TaxID=33035 RepID=UPI0036F2D415
MEACTTHVDFSVYEDDIKERLRATNHILVILWKYIEPLVEEMEDALKHQDENSASGSLANTLESQIQNGLPLPETCCNNAHENTGGKALSPVKIRQDKEEIKEVLQEETERIQLAKTTSIVDGKNPGITYNQQYAGSGYKKAADDLFSILHKVAEKKAIVQSEQKLSDELQAEADKLHYGNAHKGIHLTINRITDVPDYMITGYQHIAPELLRISKRLQKTVAPILRSEAEGGKQKYLLMGKRLDMRAYHRIDGALFSRTHLPTDRMKLAVAFLADESGSMAGYNRITHTCKTAIVLEDFCKNLGVPITIYGHSTNERGVALYSYAEFDSLDNQDCFRIMDMSARNGNRDGAALRFVAERLLTQPAEQKLLIISSDGQPADAGYSGTEAEADLRAIKQEYARKRITIFAAAIGNDKDNIKRIYGDHFLDITNLEDLPKNMVQLVKQYLI